MMRSHVVGVRLEDEGSSGGDDEADERSRRRALRVQLRLFGGGDGALGLHRRRNGALLHLRRVLAAGARAGVGEPVPGVGPVLERAKGRRNLEQGLPLGGVLAPGVALLAPAESLERAPGHCERLTPVLGLGLEKLVDDGGGANGQAVVPVVPVVVRQKAAAVRHAPFVAPILRRARRVRLTLVLPLVEARALRHRLDRGFRVNLTRGNHRFNVAKSGVRGGNAEHPPRLDALVVHGHGCCRDVTKDVRNRNVPFAPDNTLVLRDHLLRRKIRHIRRHCAFEGNLVVVLDGDEDAFNLAGELLEHRCVRAAPEADDEVVLVRRRRP
mmetsp:Transcript_17527/g.57309  ORF Transcript_17527/g.57309 Transcript_17527/m.57309 type:complete len:326 (+) Transcript_17527:48-1025(+)